MVDVDDLRSSKRQSAKVCSRCRKRKVKCDLRFPSCGACAKAGAVCRAYSASGQSNLPRSLVRALEDEIAELEHRLSASDDTNRNLSLAYSARLASAVSSIDCSRLKPFFYSILTKYSFLCPSPLPFAVAGSIPRRSPQALLRDGSSEANLGQIPHAAIDQMISNYVNIHLPQYPCIPEPALRSSLDRVLKAHGHEDGLFSFNQPAETEVSHLDYFSVFMILAISSLTLIHKNERQARSASDAFFASAIKHLENASEVADLTRLQALLLIGHYASLNPGKVDYWLCVWNATQLVLKLGLHKKSAEMLDAGRGRLQNQLFWVAYGMGRSLCSVLRLPLFIQQESITVSRDAHSGANTRYSSSSHLYAHRMMETEAYRVLYLEEETPDLQRLGLTHWLSDIKDRLDKWLEKASAFSQFDMLEFRKVQYGWSMARLSRPCPRIGERTLADRQRCFDACAMLVEDYQKQVKRRRLFYPWHALHILFEAAIIMLEACWALRTSPEHRTRARLVLSVTIPDCLDIISELREGWVEAAMCCDFLRPLADEIAQLFRRRDLATPETAQEAQESIITRQLHSLLFPDTSVIHQHQSTLNDLPPLDLPMLPVEDCFDFGIDDDFDWTSYWQDVQSSVPFWTDLGSDRFDLSVTSQ